MLVCCERFLMRREMSENNNQKSKYKTVNVLRKMPSLQYELSIFSIFTNNVLYYKRIYTNTVCFYVLD